MSDLKFKTGDIVKHKSADFKMVVIEVSSGYGGPNGTRVECNYFHALSQKFINEKFLPEELEPFN